MSLGYHARKSTGTIAGFDEVETEILLNDMTVTMDKNIGGHLRGLHVVIINSSNGRVDFAKVFDTNKNSDSFD